MQRTIDWRFDPAYRATKYLSNQVRKVPKPARTGFCMHRSARRSLTVLWKASPSDLDAVFFQQLDKRIAGERTALVGIEDLRNVKAVQHLLYGIPTEVG